MANFELGRKWKAIVKFFTGDANVKITTYSDGERNWTVYRNL